MTELSEQLAAARTMLDATGAALAAATKDKIALTAQVAELTAANERLSNALLVLELAGTRVSNAGATTGPQWTILNSALMNARGAHALARIAKEQP